MKKVRRNLALMRLKSPVWIRYVDIRLSISDSAGLVCIFSISITTPLSLQLRLDKTAGGSSLAIGLLFHINHGER